MNEFKISAAQEAKLLELWELGQKDHNERLVHMRGDVVLLEATGDENHTSFGMDYGEKNIHRGDFMLHNHPDVLNSFSLTDMESGAYFGVNSYVITEDKSMYFTRTDLDPEQLEATWKLVRMLVAPVANIAYRDLGVLHSESSTLHMGTNDAHYINSMLANLGYIEYSYRLAAPTQAIVDKVNAYAKERIAKRAPKL